MTKQLPTVLDAVAEGCCFVCCLFTVSCSCSSKGALAAIKDPGPLEEAITRGDLSTAKKLLGITKSETESGELTLVGIDLLPNKFWLLPEFGALQ